MITYEQFRDLYDAIQGEPEFSIYFDWEPNGEYMIIKYDDGPTFQRCFGEGYPGQEIKFPSLDDLYHATFPDGVCLERDWDRITWLDDMGLFDFFEYPEEYDNAMRFYRDGVRLQDL